MITYLCGRLSSKAPTFAVIDVGGVGYGVAISLLTYERLPAVGEEVRLFTYLHVREDRMELFGFATAAEREFFELLIEVPGIGPRSAQTILSGISLPDLQEAIFHGRIHELTAVKGIGRKTAERIVLDLKDKVQLVARSEEREGGGPRDRKEGGMVEEAVMALMALGYAGGAARQAVGKALAKDSAIESVQQLIKQALKER